MLYSRSFLLFQMASGNSVIYLAVTLCALLATVSSFSYELSLSVEAGTQECFYQHVHLENVVVEFDYQVCCYECNKLHFGGQFCYGGTTRLQCSHKLWYFQYFSIIYSGNTFDRICYDSSHLHHTPSSLESSLTLFMATIVKNTKHFKSTFINFSSSIFRTLQHTMCAE